MIFSNIIVSISIEINQIFNMSHNEQIVVLYRYISYGIAADYGKSDLLCSRVNNLIK